MKTKLEEICTFADECVVSNYGAYTICQEDYVDCEHYQKIIAKKIEEYNKDDKK